MGCEGCELYPTTAKIRSTVRSVLHGYAVDFPDTLATVDQLTAPGPQHTKLHIEEICRQIAAVAAPALPPSDLCRALREAIGPLYICYAATLHRTFNTNGRNSGYASVFEQPKTFSGRVARMSLAGAPKPSEIADKPWLEGYRRLVFISDMGDALCSTVPFEFLLQEIVEPVSSEAGRRHVWLWLTKRPHRMAEFSDWLLARGITWPDNLVAMTSVTSDATVGRVRQLRRVAARYRALSVEPLWSDVELPLEGIDWVIVGGQSGANSKPFEVEWARRIIAQCREAGASPFVKQLGAAPRVDGNPLNLVDGHGGDWTEENWPADIRIRELPNAWRQAVLATEAAA